MFNVAVNHGGPYLLVVGSGTAQLCDLMAVADVAARVAHMKQSRLVMVDLLGVEPTLSFTEHLQLGAHFAAALARIDRVASVVALRFRSGTSEKAAQKAGVNLRTFTDLSEADRWLRGAASTVGSDK